jgi:FkbM family methyltransferase
MIARAKTLMKKMIEGFFGICSLDDHFIVNSFGKFPVVVDLGAGKGEFPDRILRKFPYSRIILVEPDPSQVQEPIKRFKNQNNIKVLDAAVGNGTINNGKFYLSKRCQGNSLYKSLVGEKDYLSEITVRIVTLEDVFSLFRLEKIDLLKVDIEGEEWDVLEKFSKRDFERIYQISVEFHDFLDPSLRERSERCVKLLREYGYTFVHKGTKYMYGTPYYSCLFYDRKRVKWTSGAKWLNIPKQLSGKI